MPHVHLVGWLHKDKIKPYLKTGSYEYNKDVTKLIDQTITCELLQDKEKSKVVKDLQSHTHSKSCRKLVGLIFQSCHQMKPSFHTLLIKTQRMERSN